MSGPYRRVLVAEPSASELRAGEESLFSTEAAASPAAFAPAELKALSPLYARLYASASAALAPGLEERGVPAAAAAVILRDAASSALHFAFDRGLRLARWKAASGSSAAVAASPRALSAGRAEELRALAAGSRSFNEAALAFLAPRLGLETAPVPEAPAAAPPRVPFSNRNFDGRTLWRKARRRVARAAARLWRGRAPALSFAYATVVLQDEGLFGFGLLEDVKGQGEFPAASPRAETRARLGALLAAAHPAALELLAGAGVPEEGRRNLADACLELAAAVFPADAWEGSPGHLEAAQRVLAPFGRAPLFLSEVRNVEATFTLAAAASLGMTRVGVQEGGHYGYEDDLVSAVEGVYPQFDRFATWGWRAFPPGAGPVEACPLPSPWLSERAAYWRRALGPVEERARAPFDLLLMSNKIYAYPPSPSGGAISRSDDAPAIAAFLKELVAAARARGTSVLHKFFDEATARLLARTRTELLAGGPGYEESPDRDKGLHPALLERAGLVVWDQPGTGFLECLAGGIPSLVIWPRIYNREAPWARPLFAELEAAGLVHGSPATALEEAARFKADPRAWMEAPARRRAVERFAAEYALTDRAWPGAWRRFVSEACSRR